MSQRLLVLNAYHAQMRLAEQDANLTVRMNVPAWAGYCLETAEGDVAIAKRLVPGWPQRLSTDVHAALDAVDEEERADTERPMAATGTGDRRS